MNYTHEKKENSSMAKRRRGAYTLPAHRDYKRGSQCEY